LINFQYDYNVVDDDSARELSGNNETSQDEMSSDEIILRAKKSKPQRKPTSPFCRKSYVARRRVSKHPLPMSSLAKTTSASVTQASLKALGGDVCSSPSNTESGKENDVNFSSTESKKSAATSKKDQALMTVLASTTTTPASTSTPKRASTKAASSSKKSEAAPSSTATLPEVSSAIFVRDEFDSTGEDVLNFGKGKRKRFLNVRMFPIGETMSKKMFEVGGAKKSAEKIVSPKKTKVDESNKKLKKCRSLEEEPSQRRGSIDSMLKSGQIVDKRRKSIDKISCDELSEAATLPKRRSAVAKRRNSEAERNAKKLKKSDSVENNLEIEENFG
jgi:hypothetical protein